MILDNEVQSLGVGGGKQLNVFRVASLIFRYAISRQLAYNVILGVATWMHKLYFFCAYITLL